MLYFFHSGGIHVTDSFILRQRCAALTAYNALTGSGQPLKAGDTVLVQSTGGVAMYVHSSILLFPFLWFILVFLLFSHFSS